MPRRPLSSLSEKELREVASKIAYKYLTLRQSRHPKVAVLDENNIPVQVCEVEPSSWDIVPTETGCKLKHHITRNLDQVVIYENNGDIFYVIEVGD